MFNLAAPHYRAALSHYQLDGFVSEHCDTLLDVSSLHKVGCCELKANPNP